MDPINLLPTVIALVGLTYVAVVEQSRSRHTSLHRELVPIPVPAQSHRPK